MDGVYLSMKSNLMVTRKMSVNDSMPEFGAGQGVMDVWRFTNQFGSHYLNNYGRNSYDGKGTPPISITNVEGSFQNAAWVGALDMVIYVNGDGITRKALSSAADVVAHELTHGVIDTSSQLKYRSQSGALNESYADLFGKLVENKDRWRVGEDLFVNKITALRNMANPSEFGDPDHMRNGLMINSPVNQCNSRNDFCWVHKNSGIANLASYELVKRIGKHAAGKISYTVLTSLLTPTSNFMDAAVKTLRTCELMKVDLKVKDCSAVREAWKVVGLNVPLPALPAPTTPTTNPVLATN
jgi:Zn-dependent metalloprotease